MGFKLPDDLNQAMGEKGNLKLFLIEGVKVVLLLSLTCL
jgi:hypothetical protein